MDQLADMEVRLDAEKSSSSTKWAREGYNDEARILFLTKQINYSEISTIF